MAEAPARSARRRRPNWLAGLALAALALGGCGGDGDDERQRQEQARERAAARERQQQQARQATTPAGAPQAPGVSQTAGSAAAQPQALPGVAPAAPQGPAAQPGQAAGGVVAPGAQPAPGTPGLATPGMATPGVATPGLAGEPAPIGSAAVAPAFVPFSATSPWNTPVDTAPVDPNSERLIELASLRVGVVERPGSTVVRTELRRADTRLFVNTTKWTTPVVDETGGAPVRVVCRQIICGPDAGVTTLTIPPDAAPDPRFDGWFTVINRGQGVAYDLWRARRGGDVISYQYIKRWDLNGPGFSAPVQQDPVRAVGARGSGLPLFAGLILPQELQAGRINHALAISVPGPAQRNYVQPASVTDGVGRLNSLPEGARIRLRRTAELGPLPGGTNRRSAQAILEALKRYGAIVVDRAAVPTLYAQKNFTYGRLLFGNEVQTIRLDDFEVIKLPPLLQDPPLSASFVNPAAPGTASGVAPGDDPAGAGTAPGGEDLPATSLPGPQEAR